METWETYLVEHYRPGASLDDLEELVRELYAQAGIPFERITGAVWLESGEGTRRPRLLRPSDALTSPKGAR